MKWNENRKLTEDVLDKLRWGRRMTFRLEDCTLTDFIVCTGKTYYMIKGVKPEYTDETVLQFSRGKAHHGVLEVYYFREVEVERDSIPGHVDMIGDRPTEIFTTIVSARKEPDAFPIKMRQCMGYSYMMDRLDFDMLVFHLMGDYTRPIKPKLKGWTLYFNQDEVNDTWRIVLNRREIIRYALERNIEPKLTPMEFGRGEKECRGCGYKHVCSGYQAEPEVKEDEFKWLR